MGTDIHMLLQLQAEETGAWSFQSVPCYECKGSGRSEYRRKEPLPKRSGKEILRYRMECRCCQGEGRVWGYGDRNYDLFAQLADVRNGGELKPVVPKRRGLPPGVNVQLAELEREHEAERLKLGLEWEDFEREPSPYLGDHSFHWLTLAELLAYDRGRHVYQQALMYAEDFERWDGEGSPWKVASEMLTYTSERGRVWTPEKWRQHRQTHELGPKRRTLIEIEYLQTYEEAAPTFWRQFVPLLQALGEPGRVRIVMGFDS